MRQEVKDPFSSPIIESAAINFSSFSGKTPTNSSISRPKSFSNIRKSSLDTYSNWKNSNNFSQLQSCSKPPNEKSIEVSQSLLNHLKILNGTFNPNLKSTQKTQITPEKAFTIEKPPSQTNKPHHAHNHSLNLTVSKSPSFINNKTIHFQNQSQNSRDKLFCKPQRPNTTTNSNKKFIDLSKRGGSIAHIQGSTNLSAAKQGISLNSSHNNLSSVSTNANKGKNSQNCETSHSSQYFGKELENQTLGLIQELQGYYSSSGNFETLMTKMLDFLKKIPGIDPLFIALIGKLEEIMVSNEENNRRKIKELDLQRIKELESHARKEKELQTQCETLQTRLSGMLDILSSLQRKGIDLDEMLRVNETDNSDHDKTIEKKYQKSADVRYVQEPKEDFADESLINDSEESSFNYFGKPEDPLSSLRALENKITSSHKQGGGAHGFRLNLKELEKRKNLESFSESFNNNQTKENHFKKKKK